MPSDPALSQDCDCETVDGRLWFCDDECHAQYAEGAERGAAAAAAAAAAAVRAPPAPSRVPGAGAAPQLLMVIFDLETTGLDTDASDIIEIGASLASSVHAAGGADSASASASASKRHKAQSRQFTALVQLARHVTVPCDATRVHGIRTCDLSADDGVLEFAQVWEQFMDWVDRWRARTGSAHVVLVAHNCYAFDKLILQSTCARAGIKLPEWLHFSDSLLALRRVYAGMFKSFALQALARTLVHRTAALAPVAPRSPPSAIVDPGLAYVVQSHRALDDVRLLQDVIDSLPRLAGGSSGQEQFYCEVERLMQPKVRAGAAEITRA
jgi:DNA polymerase III epsilon subunit-like protein